MIQSKTNKSNEMVVVELEVAQFGPFDNPQWTNGVFVVRPDQAVAIAKHFTDLAASYGPQVVSETAALREYKENITIHIRPIIPIPLEIYDHFIHSFEHEGKTLYVICQKYNGAYVVIEDGYHSGSPTLELLERGALSGFITAYIKLSTARSVARRLDLEGGLDWKKGMIK